MRPRAPIRRVLTKADRPKAGELAADRSEVATQLAEASRACTRQPDRHLGPHRQASPSPRAASVRWPIPGWDTRPLAVDCSGTPRGRCRRSNWKRWPREHTGEQDQVIAGKIRRTPPCQRRARPTGASCLRQRQDPVQGAAFHAALRQRHGGGKYGGHAMGDPERDLRHIVLIKQSGVNPIVVHGGGPHIGSPPRAAPTSRSGVQRRLARHRPDRLEVVEMVLAGSVNKEIVAAINAEGGKAVGISGKDANPNAAPPLERRFPRSRFQYRGDRRSRLCRRSHRRRSRTSFTWIIDLGNLIPGDRPDRGWAGKARRSTSMRTRSPRRLPRRSRQSGCCCSPTSRACSTRTAT